MFKFNQDLHATIITVLGTIQALRTKESIKRDEARRKEQRHHGRDMFE